MHVQTHTCISSVIENANLSMYARVNTHIHICISSIIENADLNMYACANTHIHTQITHKTAYFTKGHNIHNK